jgi:hypothetical protein
MLTENQKRLNLAEFALKKVGYPREEYVVSAKEVEKLPRGYAETGIGIAKFQGKWAVYIFDRADFNQIAMHDTIYTAVTDFYWRCTNPPTQYDFREEWERETGLEFDLYNVE